MYVERLFDPLGSELTRVAFRCGGHALTRGELDARSRRFAAALRAAGFAHGDRLASLLPTGLDLVVALLGAYRLGVVFVPINTRYREAEVAHILSDSGARGVLVERDSAQDRLLGGLRSQGGPCPPLLHVDPGSATRGASGLPGADSHAPLDGAPAVGDEDLALLIYTSGTTGRSKGVELPFRAIVSNIDSLTALWRWTADDELVLALPLFHVHGLAIGVHGTLIRGCRAVLHERFEPRAVAEAIEDGGTIFMGVPTMYALLAREMDADPVIAGRLSRARLLTSGSAALSPALFERFERDTGHRILERYGMSETMLTLSNPYEGERRRGSVGLPVPGCEVRVVDDALQDVAPGEVGQIVVRGPCLMRGYWRLPEKTAETFRDGWFVTGDAATIAPDGYVSIVGRRSVDIIKSGGFKVSAREIEDVLDRDARVLEVAVVGLPDEVWGERIAAFVVSSGCDPEQLAGDLMALSGAELADYKRVREVRVVEALPRNALGKVQKHLLRGTF